MIHPRYQTITGVNFRREGQSEEKEGLSDQYVTKRIWRNYQEIVDNHRKRLGLPQPFYINETNWNVSFL